jgi:hypothetical protein
VKNSGEPDLFSHSLRSPLWPTRSPNSRDHTARSTVDSQHTHS